jgi:hypothetical protein
MSLRRILPYLIITVLYLLLTYIGIRYMVSKYPRPNVKPINHPTVPVIR